MSVCTRVSRGIVTYTSTSVAIVLESMCTRGASISSFLACCTAAPLLWLTEMLSFSAAALEKAVLENESTTESHAD